MNNNQNKKGKFLNGRVKFLLVMLAVYSVLALLNPILFEKSFQYFLKILFQIIPLLGFVYLILFLTNLFLDPGWIKKHVGKKSGVSGWLYAILGGILISGPPYILYPMLAEMRNYGARNGLIATMLYNRNVKIHFLPALVYYFGIKYTVVLSIYILLFSILNGKILEMIAG
jgi:uncharacterized membrane protein YraQ (UPF0718 family)